MGELELLWYRMPCTTLTRFRYKGSLWFTWTRKSSANEIWPYSWSNFQQARRAGIWGPFPFTFTYVTSFVKALLTEVNFWTLSWRDHATRSLRTDWWRNSVPWTKYIQAWESICIWDGVLVSHGKVWTHVMKQWFLLISVIVILRTSFSWSLAFSPTSSHLKLPLQSGSFSEHWRNWSADVLQD